MTAWRTVPPKRRAGDGTSAYKARMKEVAERALKTGEGCWFHQYGICKYQGAPFDWTPGNRNALSFTAHHIERVMDGGEVIPDSDKLVPSHKGCNSADGLRAQNARRAAQKAGVDYDAQVVIEALSAGLSPYIPMNEPTSRDW